MTEEKMLTIINEIEKNSADMCKVYELCKVAEKVLKEEILEKAAKDRGVKPNQIKLVKQMMKRNADREMYHCYFPIGEKYGFMDAYQAVILNDSLGYPSNAEIKSAPVDFSAFTKDQTFCDPIKVDVADLKTFIKIKKAEKAKDAGYKYLVGNQCFDARLLLEMLEGLGIDEIQNNERANWPCRMENAAGEIGILCPVRT